MISLVKYPGGKAMLLPEILKLITQVDSTCIVEVYGGSAKFLLNVSPMTLYGRRKVVYNDYDERIANVFLQVRDHPNELEARFNYYVQARKWFDLFKKNQADDPIEDAFRVLYVLALGRPERTFDTMAFRRSGEQNDIESVKGSLSDVHEVVKYWMVENRPALDIIRGYDSPDTLFYIDPPYLDTSMYRGTRHDYTVDDYIQLKRTLDGIKGKYVMNHYGHPTIRQIFGEPQMSKVYDNIANSQNKNTGAIKKFTREEWFYYKL